MIESMVKFAVESRLYEIESAINRFRDCGVELARFSIMELGNGITHLCVDGIPRFSWQMVCNLPNWLRRS